MIENPDLMREIIKAVTVGKVFGGGCHCGAVRFWMAEQVSKF